MQEIEAQQGRCCARILFWILLLLSCSLVVAAVFMTKSQEASVIATILYSSILGFACFVFSCMCTRSCGAKINNKLYKHGGAVYEIKKTQEDDKMTRDYCLDPCCVVYCDISSLQSRDS